MAAMYCGSRATAFAGSSLGVRCVGARGEVARPRGLRRSRCHADSLAWQRAQFIDVTILLLMAQQ